MGGGEEKVFEDAKHDSGFEEGFKVGDQEAQKVKVKEEVKAKEVKLTVKGLETVKVNLSKEVEVERSSGHRVTFNDQNEVASQDRDGTFKVGGEKYSPCIYMCAIAGVISRGGPK